MKKTKFLYYSLLFILAAGFFTACEPDPVDIENPSISFVEADGYMYKDTLLEKGQVFKVKLNATPGTNDLYLLGINENDVKIDLDRIVSGVNATPALLLGADAQGFEKEIEIMGQEEGLSKYTFYVEDADGNTNGVSFTVLDVFKPIDNEVNGLVVYNIDGPNFGSINLQVPEAVAKADPTGDIGDLGIDLNELPANNWIQRIEPKNGATLYLPGETLEGFDQINTKEALKAAVEAGTEVIVSQTLSIGDVYLVKTASDAGETFDYFMIQVDNIVVTESDNLDYYEFSIKQALNM